MDYGNAEKTEVLTHTGKHHAQGKKPGERPYICDSTYMKYRLGTPVGTEPRLVAARLEEGGREVTAKGVQGVLSG